MFNPNDECSYYMWLLFFKIDNKNQQEIRMQNQLEEDDIFDSEILSEFGSEEQKGVSTQKLTEAVRASCMFHGDGEQVMSDIAPLQIVLITKQVHLKNISYQQASIKKYGHQGILLKQSPNLFGGWDQRYCVLKQKRFIYKDGKYPTSQTTGILNFNLLSCQLIITKDGNQFQKFTIVMNNSQKTFTFKGQTHQQTKQWAKMLKQAIVASQGYNKNFNYLSKYHRFWRKDYQSEKQFQRQAQTGDVVLFRSSKNSAVVQRAITMDQFDHVAFVLLNALGEVLLFQANGGFGVGICPWKQFMKKEWHKNYEIVLHRKLNISRTPLFLQTIQTFVSKNLGKKYNFSLKQYIFSRSSTPQMQRNQFFCSSLVAKIYKTLQLLQPKKSCTQYLPSFFNQKDIQLRTDGKYGYASMQMGKIIVFQNSN